MATTNQASSIPPTSHSGAPIALVWAGGMLGLFAFWLQRDHAELSTVVIALPWIAAACSLLLGLWQFRMTRTPVDAATESGRRRTLGRLLLAGGVVLAVLAVYLYGVLGLEGFSEAVGLGLFALIPLIGGGSLLTSSASAANFFPRLAENHALLRNVLFGIGGARCLAVFLYLAFVAKIGNEYLPQLAAVLFEGLLTVTCAIWLISVAPEERSPLALRCLVLIVGGVTGLILALLAVGLVYSWRQDIVFGGLGVWRGEKGYHVWVCAYLGLIGLVLMFGSVLAVHTATRTHAVLRQALYGYNALVQGLLLLAILAVLNVLTYSAFPMTLEWNRGGLTSLSPSTKNFLANMKEQVTIYVLIPNLQSFSEVHTLLGNCQTQTSKLKVEFVGDNDRKKYNELARRFKDLSSGNLVPGESRIGRGLLLVAGSVADDESKTPPHAFISDQKLFTENLDKTTHQPTFRFNGEAEIMRQMAFLLQGQKQRKVYILQGEDELDINETSRGDRMDPRDPMKPLGAFELVSRLRKDNYDVEGLTFDALPREKQPNKVIVAPETGPDKRKEIPRDATAVIILGASKPIPRDALSSYMARGGKLLVTLDLVVNRLNGTLEKSGMEEFLRDFGVDATDSFLLHIPQARDEDANTVVASPPKSQNIIAKEFFGKPFILNTVRVVKPSAAPAKGFKSEKLLEVSPQFNPGLLEDSAIRALFDPIRRLQEMLARRQLDARLAKEPISVALAVSEDVAEGKPRLVVFGDTEFVANAGLAPRPDIDVDTHYGLFASALEWMSERQEGFIGPPARESPVYSLNLLNRQADLERMTYVPAWLMLLVVINLGIGVWLVRRR